MLIMQKRTQHSQGPQASISPWLSKCLREGCFMTTPNRKRWETLRRDKEGRKEEEEEEGMREAKTWDRGKSKGEERGEKECGFCLFSPYLGFRLLLPFWCEPLRNKAICQSITKHAGQECGQFTELRGMNECFNICVSLVFQPPFWKAGKCE